MRKKFYQQFIGNKPQYDAVHYQELAQDNYDFACMYRDEGRIDNAVELFHYAAVAYSKARFLMGLQD